MENGDQSPGLPRIPASELASMRSSHEPAAPLVMCTAVYVLPDHWLPYESALSRPFLEWCVSEYGFKSLPDEASAVEQFEKLSAVRKSVAMPDSLNFHKGVFRDGEDLYPFTHLLLTADRVGTKLYAKTAACEKVIGAVVPKLAEFAGLSKPWSYYEAAVVEKHFNTITRVAASKNISELLGSELQNFFNECVPQHARNMIRKGAAELSAENFDVTVHPYNLEAKVHLYDRASASLTKMDLKLAHQRQHDVPGRTLTVETDLDFESHTKLTGELVAYCEGRAKGGRK